MPRKHYRHARQGGGPRTHFCAWPKCTELLPAGMLMDQDHWLTVPWKLRKKHRDATQAGNQAAAERAAGEIKEWARHYDADQQWQTAGAR